MIVQAVTSHEDIVKVIAYMKDDFQRRWKTFINKRFSFQALCLTGIIGICVQETEPSFGSSFGTSVLLQIF